MAGKPPGAGGLDALAGGVLGEAQLAHAVGEHGGVPGRGVQPALVHLGQVGKERGGGGSVLGDEGMEGADELGVG